MLKINLPNTKDENNSLWELTSNLTEVQEIPDEEFSVPHPNHYKKWFEFLDRIDLRRHLSDVENVLIEGALKKTMGLSQKHQKA